MAQQIEVKVPDIGDFKDVAVIEVLVKAGESVAVDTSLIMVESDKASMEFRPRTQASSRRSGSRSTTSERRGDDPRVETGAAAAPKPARHRSRRRHHRPRFRGILFGKADIDATWWCWAQVPAATRPPSALPISA